MAPVSGLKRSKVWDHFSGIGECKYCQKKMKNIKIFNLWRHIRAAHPSVLDNDVQHSLGDIHVHVQDVELELYTSGEQPESPSKLNVENVHHSPELLESPASPSTSTWSESTSSEGYRFEAPFAHEGHKSKQITDAVLFMIAKDNLSTNLVNGIGFKHFMEVVCRRYTIPNRKTFNRKLDEKFESAIAIKKELVSYVTDLAITIDMWTDAVHGHNLIGFTGHFVQDFRIKSELLGVKPMYEGDTNEHVRVFIVNMLADWSLDIENVVACVLDADCVITKAIQDTFSSAKLLPCFALQLNRLVQAALSKDVSPTVALIVEKVRDIVTFFKKNAAAANLLNKNQELADVTPLKLKLNCSSLWNSCFVMLQRFVEISEYVVTALVVSNDAPEMLGEHELIIAKEVLDLLKPFVAITEEMCPEQFTSRTKLVPMIHCLKYELAIISVETDAGTTFKEKLIELVNDQFSDVGSVALNGLATLLDPRFKNVSFDTPSSYSEALTLVNPDMKDVVQRMQTNVNNGLAPDESLDSNSLWKFHDEKVVNLALVQTSETDIASVLTQYLNTPTIPRSSDPLVFWQQHQFIYPTLINLAKRYLCIPATSVPSVRLFSKAGNVLARKRSLIEGSRVEKILILGSLSYEEWSKLN